MKPEEIVKIADAAYPDGMVGLYLGQPDEKHGDTLAQFIVFELQDVHDPDLSDDEQLEEAVRVMERAANELLHVAAAMEAKMSK